MNKFIASSFVVMMFVSLIASFIPQIEAVDYRDSTGFTPSWAKNSGYYSVLNRCNDLIGDTSRDGNWCMDWVAYVLDQGIENFPQSTESTSSPRSTSNLSERVCTENMLCAFPGEFLKYRTMDTYDDFEEIAIVEFKEKINDYTIRVFIDGFGSKPLTYNLNLKTGIETHDEYKNVNRPFNLLEPIPMKIGQQVNQYSKGYYGSTIDAEATTNLKGAGSMDIVRTLMGAQTDLGNGDVAILAYDKETGIQITYIEKYELDGKQYHSGMILIDTNIFSIPTKISSTKELVIQEKVPFLDMPDDNEPIDTSQPTQSQPTQSQPTQSQTTPDSSSDSEISTGGIIFANFVVFGIPIIIIGLIIWKIKQRRRKSKIDLSKSFNR